jgi:hypothetical protein
VADAASNGLVSDAEHAEKLVSGARLAFAASSATASDARITLASRAIDLLSSVAGATGSEYMRLSHIGYRWRVKQDAHWPPCRLIATPQPLDKERWLESLPTTYDQLRARQDNLENLPAWTLKRVEDAELTMNALQATFFGLAAQLNHGNEQL